MSMALSSPAFVPDPEAATGCFHCGQPLPQDAPLAMVAGMAHGVCCQGCAAAAAWIAQAGLADYYRLRMEDGNRVETATSDFSAWDRPDVQAGHIFNSAAGCEITVVVEGLRCAACAWLIDRALMREVGVSSVGVNAVTGRMRLCWRPAETKLSSLLGRVASLGYRPHLASGEAIERERRQERNSLLLKIGLAALAATQAMMFSEALYLDSAHQMPLATRDFFRWLTFLVCTPVVFYSGWPFLAGMAREWRARSFGMDTLAATSIVLAYAASFVETIRGGPHVWFDAAAMFVLFLLAARLLERFARQRASAQLDLLARAQPALAWREVAGIREQCPLHALRAGDSVYVPSRDVVPADGVILESDAMFDESLLTGEATAIGKGIGDPVYAGSVCLQHGARIRVTDTGAATRLSQVQRLVTRAQAERPRLARLADRAASYFVVAMFALSALAFAWWWQVDAARAFGVALAVLVAACPCALSLAVPAALASANDALARHGVLLVGNDALERLASADTALLDKTGTLTTREPHVVAVDTFSGVERSEALAMAAALEIGSTHPLAAAFHQDETRSVATQVQVLPGRGVEGLIEGRKLRLGRADFSCCPVDEGAVWLCEEGKTLARFTIAETPRADAQAMVADLRRLGLDVAVISGDGSRAVAALCHTLGIADFHSRQTPEQKLAELKLRQTQGQRVLMLGDGINDAPVLAGADVSVAMGSGAALAQRSADVLLLGHRLSRLPQAIALARRTRRVMRQNLVWAAAYNLAAVTIAAAGWIHPGFAALGMAGSSLLVTCNALRLSRASGFGP